MQLNSWQQVYQHFDRSYIDEAAAALLGTDLPSGQNGAQMTLSPGFTAHLKLKIDQLQQQGVTQEAMALILCAELGPLVPIAFNIIDQLNGSIVDVVVHRVCFNVPKNWAVWDIDHRLVEAMITANTAPSAPAKTRNRSFDGASTEQVADGVQTRVEN